MQTQNHLPKAGNSDKSAQRTPTLAQSGVSRDFHNLLADIEDLLEEATSLTGEELIEARDRLNTRIAEARATAQDVSDSVVQRARQTATVANEYVHEQPWRALGTGIAIAFLLGFVIARRA
ncbi:DUF883 domain-containing protein [Pseudomonas sp. PDM16]|uniref:DUF883 family protein n=1 Tax=Pseudomonas sp. PDM16 TaxID=2769292 RepID=UPI001782D65F|nr:DUF883 family protein [Pseudomonas sp. PDM16]MBD9416977.1 DUF883 domain-containing protein [Pseudomonas sp. PDM16]